MPDLHESIGQHMEEKTTNKFKCVKGHIVDRTFVGTISVFEGDLTRVYVYNPII